MVVWGGSVTALQITDTGGRYDPVADSWLPTTTLDAPSARSYHSAVWTGSYMVVWGGSPPALNNGGRYALGHSVDDDGDGFTECAGDCNDWLTEVFPGAIEICDGLDNDCDPLTNEWADDDGDGLSACEGDCAPADGSVFAVPDEIAGLMFAGDKETLSWTSAAPSAGSGTVHDVVRGAVDELPVGTGPSEVCLAPGAGSTTADPDSPSVSETFWYLVRGRNACGVGGYGFESGGAERTSDACP